MTILSWKIVNVIVGLDCHYVSIFSSMYFTVFD